MHFNLHRGVILSRTEKDCLAVRQNFRPAMAGFPLRQLSQRFRCASPLRYLLQRATDGRRENDAALIAPTGPARGRGVAESGYSSAIHRNLLQLVSGKETERLPIGRKEGIDCAF